MHTQHLHVKPILTTLLCLALATGSHAATTFLTNLSTKTLASNEGDAGTGLTNGTDNNGLHLDIDGDSTVLTLSADDGGGSITFNTVDTTPNNLFMSTTAMGMGNEKWGSGQNWTFTLDQTISFDALHFLNNESSYTLQSVAWKDGAAVSGTGWSFSSDGTIGIFSLTSGEFYDFTTAGVADVAAGTEIGFGAFGGANGGDLLYSFTITPVGIPEPTAALLGGLGALLLLRRRRG